MEILNPYHRDDPSLAPFAGRRLVLQRLDHYLKEAVSHSALIFTGKRWQGKTALLQHVQGIYDDLFVHIDLPLQSLQLAGEEDLFRALIDGAERSIAQRDITLTRLPAAQPAPEDWRQWLDLIWLPGVAQVIRPHRKLVLLLDDAGAWLRAIDEGRLPADSPAYFKALMQQHPQLKLVISFPAEREDDLERLAPLVDSSHVLRLANLTPEESAQLLRMQDAYSLSDEAVQTVYHATGGQPLFLQRFGYQIYDYYERIGTSPITPEIIKTLTPLVYRESHTELETFWNDSTDNEQLLLSTLSSLHYEDPLKPMTVERLANWLLDTDCPLDQTAVNAVLRGLEYRELIHQRPSGIELSSGIFQTWLLSHGDESISSPQTSAAPLRLPALILFVALIVLALMLLVILSNVPQETGSSSPQPTVTLLAGE